MEDFNHLHVKKHKSGSPNELSLDVLDAARSELDEKKARSDRISNLASRNPLSGSAKINGSKHMKPNSNDGSRAKKRNRRLLISGALVVVLGIVAAIVYFGLDYAENKVPFHDEFRSVVHELAPADEVLVAVDDIMTSSPENVDIETRKKALANFDKARTSISSAKEAAANIEGDIVTSQEDIAYERFERTVEVRESMIGTAEKAITYANETEERAGAFEAVWSDVFEADELARAASEQANLATTIEQTEAARDATQIAYNRFAAALASLTELSQRYKDVDVSVHIEYLQKRMEALEHAIATGDALVEGDREAAETENDSYNDLDEEAASIAAELPLSIGEIIKAGYAENMESYCAEYLSAKEQSAELDAAIAKYLES